MPVESVGGHDSVSFGIHRPNDIRPWFEMWEIVQYNRTLVDAAYRDAASTGNPEIHLKTAVMNFCVCCSHLIDHLGCDPSRYTFTGDQKTDDQLREQNIKAIRDELTTTYEPLDIVLDACNTYKHHTRRKSFRNVRIRDFSSTPPRNAFGWTGATETLDAREDRDARKVVDKAVVAWNSYLTDQHLI